MYVLDQIPVHGVELPAVSIRPPVVDRLVPCDDTVMVNVGIEATTVHGHAGLVWEEEKFSKGVRLSRLTEGQHVDKYKGILINVSFDLLIDELRRCPGLWEGD